MIFRDEDGESMEKACELINSKVSTALKGKSIATIKTSDDILLQLYSASQSKKSSSAESQHEEEEEKEEQEEEEEEVKSTETKVSI